MSIVLVGSTSGSITLQEPAVAGTTVLSLPAVTGTILTDTAPKVGNVLQVVQATQATQTSTTSSTPTTTNLSVSITPSSTSSKIFVLFTAKFSKGSAGTGAGVNTFIYRNTTQLIRSTGYAGFTNTSLFNYETIAGQYLDSPSTTSSTTYSVYFASSDNSTQATYVTDGDVGVITVMEIAG